ncbi:MAG: hypothetical protein WAO01_10780, partial [Bradyrhizobium sp.]
QIFLNCRQHPSRTAQSLVRPAHLANAERPRDRTELRGNDGGMTTNDRNNARRNRALCCAATAMVKLKTNVYDRLSRVGVTQA